MNYDPFSTIFDPTRPHHGPTRPMDVPGSSDSRLCSPGMSQVAAYAYFQLQTLNITTSYLTNGQVDAGVNLIIVFTCS